MGQGGQLFSLWLRCRLWCPYSTSEWLCFNSSLLFVCTLGCSRCWLSSWVPATPVGGLGWVPRSLQPQASRASGGRNRKVGRLCVYFSALRISIWTTTTTKPSKNNLGWLKSEARLPWGHAVKEAQSSFWGDGRDCCVCRWLHGCMHHRHLDVNLRTTCFDACRFKNKNTHTKKEKLEKYKKVRLSGDCLTWNRPQKQLPGSPVTCFFPGRTMALGRTLVIPILILAPSKDALESVSRACTIMVLPAIKQIIFKGKILPRWSTLTSKYVFFPLKPLTYPIIIGRTTSPVRQIHPSASPAKSIFSSLNTHTTPHLNVLTLDRHPL